MAKTLAKVRIHPNKQQEFIEAVTELAACTRKDEGCLFYELYQMTDDTTCFYFLEEWRSASDLEGHFTKTYFRDFISKMDGVELEGAEPVKWSRVV